MDEQHVINSRTYVHVEYEVQRALLFMATSRQVKAS